MRKAYVVVAMVALVASGIRPLPSGAEVGSVDATLAAKGFERTDSAEADFLVVYFVEFKRKLNASSVSFGVGGGRYGRYGGVGYDTGISEYDQVILTIDMIDPSSGKMFWRGVGLRAAYDGSSPEKTTKIVNQSVEKILKKFPPKQ